MKKLEKNNTIDYNDGDEENFLCIVRKEEANGEEKRLETAQYLSAQEVSDKWGITKRRVQNLCVSNRIPGAFRIGNMWAIPADASKPKDARVRERIEGDIPLGIIIRKARRALKSIVDISVKELIDSGLSPVETLRTIIVIFASKLLETVIDNNDLCLEICELFFRHKIDFSISDKIEKSISKYISENDKCLDDSLSWVYQFATKKSEYFMYNDTQFFTEKYMINTLVDSIHIDSESKIIDPACGGGNFLIYAFDSFVKQKPGLKAIERATYALENLYGYEIDPFLAYVGAFNLKLKAMTYISSEMKATISEFNNLHPLVFYPQNESVSGFLDIQWEKQCVINCDTGETLRLEKAFDGANVVVTNPPFRTIKGMPLKQKEYLQKFYPKSKCDLCNAFIERVMQVLPMGGKAAMVTQNSWMYLDSFTSLRSELLSNYTIDIILELGSNAFYDLSGEKANIALVTATKKAPTKTHKIELGLFRHLQLEQIESVLENKTYHTQHIKQIDVRKNAESRFDMVSTDHLRKLQIICDQYKNYAVPMQGTSTGDAKNLIDYYWKHIGEEDWILVSKGGGYSRFEGLNSYCVKWGKDGEYIKGTKGSAIRNANYFNETQLVFSDTGTAGLNVRVLLPKQIFIASGPGIRIIKGKELAHLAFLNSRFAAFFVRLLSPKLTIAAGYIGKIPVTKDILNSSSLEKYAKECLDSKQHRLTKRPNNIEFSYVRHPKGKSILEMAKTWFVEDINDEWTQLLNEQKIEDVISLEMKLSIEDKQTIDNYIGQRIILSNDKGDEQIFGKADVSGLLGYDCFPRRTKASKKSLGTDGLIELISQIKEKSCESVYSELKSRFTWFERDYVDLYMHALVMSSLRYRENSFKRINASIVLSSIGLAKINDKQFANKWLETRFNTVHYGTFEGKSLYFYDLKSNELMRVQE